MLRIRAVSLTKTGKKDRAKKEDLLKQVGPAGLAYIQSLTVGLDSRERG